MTTQTKLEHWEVETFQDENEMYIAHWAGESDGIRGAGLIALEAIASLCACTWEQEYIDASVMPKWVKTGVYGRAGA